jgi:hypothetical protein
MKGVLTNFVSDDKGKLVVGCIDLDSIEDLGP